MHYFCLAIIVGLFHPSGMREIENTQKQVLFPGEAYDPQVPTPEQILGYNLGEKFTLHWRLQPYIEVLAKASARISWQQYGTTFEGRPLLLAIVTAGQNHSRLAEIRQAISQLIQHNTTKDFSAVKNQIANLPAVVWLSFNVHGNEPSSTEAALALLYQLAAGTDAKTRAILDSTVTIIDPCLNPDGRDRYVNWYQSIVGKHPNADAQTLEHNEPWPGGRGNHYNFDLNRDWAFLSQPETNQRLKAYLQWNPQVHVDFHEMEYASSYFFFPADVPINNNLPSSILSWQKVFGLSNAAAFDSKGWLYYTGEDFDLFYPGYGDSWPSLQGAIGMTYEQGGHSAAGLVVQRDDQSFLSLADRIQHHFAAAFTTLETTATHRVEILQDFVKFFQHAQDEAAPIRQRSYLFTQGDDPLRSITLCNLLTRQGIEVKRATEEFVAGPVQRFGGGDIDREQFAKGTFIVSLDQPRWHLANALLEPHPVAEDLFFYDVSSWSLPLAYGVEAYWLDAALTVPSEALSSEIQVPLKEFSAASYAYLIPAHAKSGPVLLYHLLANNYQARVASKEFQIQTKSYARGSIIIPVHGNAETLHKDLQELAKKWNVPLDAVATGLAERGMNLGSNFAQPILPRKLAVLSGPGISSTSYGSIRFLLENEYEFDLASLNLDNLNEIDLAHYDVLIMPDGSQYTSRLAEKEKNQIEQWIKSGGLLVAIGGGARWFTKDESGITSLEISQAAQVQEASAPARWIRVEEAQHHQRRQAVPGTILAVQLDPGHALSFGYAQGPIYVMQETEQIFALPQEGHAVGVFADDPKVSGYLSYEMAKKFQDKAYLVEYPLGKGHIVLFADDPNFRSLWHGLTRLFLNAILLPK